MVSIHAPARGATLFRERGSPLTSFNPRARAGRDRAGTVEIIAYKFQSTRPRGARLIKIDILPLVDVSIHAPARGATQSA